MKQFRLRLLAIVGSAAFVAAFRWSYSEAVVPLFWYMGYRFDPLPLSLDLLSWIFAITPAIWMPIAVRRPSQILCWLLYLLVVVPVAVVPVHTIPDRAAGLTLFNVSVTLSFAALCAVGHLPRARVALPRLDPRMQITFTCVVWALAHAYILWSFGLHPIPSLLEVYDIRLEYRENLVSSGRLVGYLMAWTANIINPVLIGSGLITRHRILALIGFVGQILIFSATGFKSIFFSWIVVVALYLLLHQRRVQFGIVMTWGFAAIVLVVTLLDSLSQSHFLVSLFVRRLIATPGLLTGFYFDFFSNNAKAMLGHSILHSFVSYPYEVTPPFLIGYYYLHNVDVSANSHIWADAFANFGFFGVFLFTAILCFIFWLYDSATMHVDLRLASIAVAMPALSLANSALLTSLLTHGFLFALIVMWISPSIRAGEFSTRNLEDVPTAGKVHLRYARS